MTDRPGLHSTKVATRVGARSSMSRCRYLLLVCLLLCSSGPVSAVTLGYADHPFAPYQTGYGREPADPPGMAVELVLESAQRLELPVVLERLPVRRLLQSVRYGSLDGVFSFSYSAERSGYLAFPLTRDGQIDASKALFAVDYTVFTRPGFDLQPLTQGIAALRHYRVGVLKDSAVAEYLEGEHIPFEVARTPELNLDKLRHGRLDMVLAAEQPTYQLIQSLGWQREIRGSSRPLFHWNYFLVFNRDFYLQHWSLCEAWWAQIQQRRPKVVQARSPLYR